MAANGLVRWEEVAGRRIEDSCQHAHQKQWGLWRSTRPTTAISPPNGPPHRRKGDDNREEP